MQNNRFDLPLDVRSLHKRYGSTVVLKQLDLRVEPGAIHGLVGLNGSGKTTTLECVLGMQRYDGGDVHVLGQQPTRLHETRGDVVGIFDSISLHPNLTVRQVMQHARLLCEEPARSPAEVETLLSLSRYRNFKIKHLSLGNRRRAAIAQALLGNPRFIVLDEPFNGLDAEGVDDVLALIQRLNRDSGTAFLLSSHQLPYLEQICSHMAILHQGRIVVSDEIERLFRGKNLRLLLRCDRPVKALQLLRRVEGVKISKHNQEDYLILELQGITSAEINQRLVSESIAVSELIMQKPSLSTLFRDITAGGL